MSYQYLQADPGYAVLVPLRHAGTVVAVEQSPVIAWAVRECEESTVIHPVSLARESRWVLDPRGAVHDLETGACYLQSWSWMLAVVRAETVPVVADEQEARRH